MATSKAVSAYPTSKQTVNLWKQSTKIKYAQYIPLILILLTIGPVTAANDRVWGTIFYGQDIVGEYIKQHTAPDERFFNYIEIPKSILTHPYWYVKSSFSEHINLPLRRMASA